MKGEDSGQSLNNPLPTNKTSEVYTPKRRRGGRAEKASIKNSSKSQGFHFFSLSYMLEVSANLMNHTDDLVM